MFLLQTFVINRNILTCSALRCGHCSSLAATSRRAGGDRSASSSSAANRLRSASRGTGTVAADEPPNSARKIEIDGYAVMDSKVDGWIDGWMDGKIKVIWFIVCI